MDYFAEGQFPAIGTKKYLVADWGAQRERYGDIRLWNDGSLDVTKYGSVTMTRINENYVQIGKDTYNFEWRSGASFSRNIITKAAGFRAGGYSLFRGKEFDIHFTNR